MIQDAFQHRSGRIISFGRFVLALFFVIIIWADRTQPALSTEHTYAFLGGYALAAIAYLRLTWSNWWLEARLAPFAHVVDLLVFTILNFVTQGYTSPFFTFAVFLLLSASIRWGWRQTGLTGFAIIVLYLIEGVTASSWGTEEFDLGRFLIRSSYLVVLSSMLILWFASNQKPAPPVPGIAGSAGADGPRGEGRYDMEGLLAYAAERFGSRRALLAWTESEEPWTYVAERNGQEFSVHRFDPGQFEPLVDPKAGDGIIIFDQERGRGLRRRGRYRDSFRLRRPLNPAFAERFRVASGLRIPVRSSDLSGDLVVLDVAGLCSDDLTVAEETAEQVAGALEHAELFHATEEAAEMRARLSLARDIHDSTVQFLAGLTFKMEGIRKSARGGRDVEREIDDLQNQLSREQQDLRRFIAELRGERRAKASADLPASLTALVRRMASQWGVDCRVESSPATIEVPEPLEQDVHQLVREAIANAVRHGKASSIATRLERRNGSLGLEIEDNGTGFPLRGEFDEEALEARGMGPHSLRERVRNIGGRLRLSSAADGSRLVITLPVDKD